MVHHGLFPMAKLGSQLLRQISKPIADRVKVQAKSTPVFRRYVCLPPAYFYNWCEVTVKMWILNLGRPVNIPVLNESMALELGANLLGEAVIFIIAAGILLHELSKSAAKEAKKEDARKQNILNIKKALEELSAQAEERRAETREIMLILDERDSQIAKMGKRLHVILPPKPAPINPDEESTPDASDKDFKNKPKDHNHNKDPNICPKPC